MSEPSETLFPELADERDRLTYARACRDRMIERLSTVDPDGVADEITKEYIEVTVVEALADLRTPGAGDFFGRIDEEGGDRWYVGRRHIETDAHDPVVVDWRAPIAAPFYRATVVDPVGLRFRRRFTLAASDRAEQPTTISAYLDEHLDDPDGEGVASGIPDPVLAEIGAERTGAMREIVATIQAEQDVVIRSPIDGCLVVQGGPGTGKTAVGLHRAAYLLFEHRRRLLRERLLVVGPNRVFLDYIADVLPSLGERSVLQRTVVDLAVPGVTIDGVDPPEIARVKGDERMLDLLEAAAMATIRPPIEPVRVPFGARTLVFEPDEIAQWIAAAAAGTQPLNRRREGLTALARREVLRRSGKDEAWAAAGPLRSALTKAWPALQPLKLVERLLGKADLTDLGGRHRLEDDELTAIRTRRGRDKRWSAADQLLIDEANSIANGPPFTFGHVVVDEAQDLSAVALRCVGRRSPTGSLTILGDLAQSTTPAGQSDWAAVERHLRAGEHRVAVLTVGYRVPAPILDVANRLLPATEVDVTESRSVRAVGVPPTIVETDAEALAGRTAAAVVEFRHRHPLTGLVAPERLHPSLTEALAAVGLEAVGRVQQLAATQIPLFGPEAVKGLEFDAVVVVNPGEIFDGSARGARLLYVAMTRAVQALQFVSDRPLPAELELG